MAQGTLTPQQALDLFGDLAPRHIDALFEAASVVDLRKLPRGLWLGRTGGGSKAYKWAVRRVVRRDWFAKLLLDGWGINVRVRQDGTHGLIHDAGPDGGVRVDLPFSIEWDTLDYGFHVLGADLGPPPLQFQDEVRAIALSDLPGAVPPAELARVGLELPTEGSVNGDRGAAPTGSVEAGGAQAPQGLMLVAYIAPLGIHRLRGTPFALVYERPAGAAEEASARRHVGRNRVYDSSCGPQRVPHRRPSPVPAPSSG